MILNDSNTKTFVSYVSQNMSKASIDHQIENFVSLPFSKQTPQKRAL